MKILTWKELTLDQQVDAQSAEPDLHEDELADGGFLFTPKGERLCRFDELDEAGRQLARRSYRLGWLDTHPEERYPYFSDDIIGGTSVFRRTGRYYCDAET